MQNLRLLFTVMAIQVCSMAGAQDANDDWARGILYGIDPDKSQSEIDDPERINESLMIEYRRFGEKLVWAEPTQHLLFNGVMMELRSTMIMKRYYVAKGQNNKAENAALRFRQVRKLFDDVDLYRSEYREKAGGMVQMAEKELNPTEAVNGFIRKTRPVILSVK